MLSTPNTQINNVFERIVKDKNGVLVLVRFTIVDGKGQIVSAEPLVKESKSEVVCLPIFIDVKSIVLDFKNYLKDTVSPFSSLEFFVSQPTRAPSL